MTISEVRVLGRLPYLLRSSWPQFVNALDAASSIRRRKPCKYIYAKPIYATYFMHTHLCRTHINYAHIHWCTCHSCTWHQINLSDLTKSKEGYAHTTGVIVQNGLMREIRWYRQHRAQNACEHITHTRKKTKGKVFEFSCCVFIFLIINILFFGL